MYFTPDGKSAIVVAEAFKRLDFRDPQTMALQYSLDDARVRGHQPRRLLDRRPLRDLHLRVRRQRWSRSTWSSRKVLGYLQAARRGRHAAGHPRLARRQDLLRRRHDGRRRLRRRRRRRSRRSASSRPARARTASTRAATARSSTSPTAARTRSTAPRRARAACRCSTSRPARSMATWPIPGGGSPDMGNVSADGK